MNMNREQLEAHRVQETLNRAGTHIRECGECRFLCEFTPDAPGILPAVRVDLCPEALEILQNLHE